MSYVLDTEIQTRTIFLDSVNADTVMEQDITFPNRCYNSYKWYLNTPITCLPANRMIISLVDAQFPNIFFNIREDVNNYLHILVGTTNYDIFVPTGQYNIETLASYINSQTSLTVTINYIGYYLIFSSTGVSFRIYGDSTIGGVIGLNKNSNGTYQTATSFANTLQMPCCFNLSGTPYVFVKIVNLNMDSLDGGDNHGSIARLDINAPFGHVCFFRPPTIEQYLIQTRSLEYINIMLTDHNNIPLCLKNSNVQFTLRIQYIRAPEIETVLSGTIESDLRKQMEQMVPYPIPMESYALESEDTQILGT